jgi:hypothetical protein
MRSAAIAVRRHRWKPVDQVRAPRPAVPIFLTWTSATTECCEGFFLEKFWAPGAHPRRMRWSLRTDTGRYARLQLSLSLEPLGEGP